MKILRKHNSTRETVRDAVQTLLASLMERFGDGVSDVEQSWRGYDLDFSFRARGFSVKGTVAVSDSDVLLDLRLPLAARMFDGRIRPAVEDELDRILSKSP